jgi:7,8-dihydroneopterin aldolase/epimerase/oxygenase
LRSKLSQKSLNLMNQNMDCLHINGIRAYGNIGVLPEEQALGQWFEVNLTLWLDLSNAAKSDRLEETHDYCADVNAIQELIKTCRFKLIERTAGAIADLVLASPEIQQVRVRLTKLTPPIPNFDGNVSVELTRTR